jgi:hypothetical protein
MLTNHERLDFDDITKSIVLLTEGNLTLGALVRHSLSWVGSKRRLKLLTMSQDLFIYTKVDKSMNELVSSQRL